MNTMIHIYYTYDDTYIVKRKGLQCWSGEIGGGGG